MNLVIDATIMIIMIIASTSIAFFYDKQSRDKVAVSFLALGLGMFNLVFVIRVSGVNINTAGAELEDVLFLMSSVFICIFTLLYFMKRDRESRYGMT